MVEIVLPRPAGVCLRRPVSSNVRRHKHVASQLHEHRPLGSSSEYVRISLPASYIHKGWAQAKVEIVVDGFHGNISPWVDTDDFIVFATQLRSLYESLNGQANFKPLDEQFTLHLVASAGGHITLTGLAWSKATFGNKLVFELELDQTFLREPLAELEVLAEAPQGDA